MPHHGEMCETFTRPSQSVKCNNTEKENTEARTYVSVVRRSGFVIAKVEMKWVNRNASPKKMVEILANTTKRLARTPYLHQGKAGQGRFCCLVFFFFLRQVSIFHCEIASADEAEFTNFLCTAEQPIPNSNPREPFCSVFVAHVPWKLSLDSQIC